MTEEDRKERISYEAVQTIYLEDLQGLDDIALVAHFSEIASKATSAQLRDALEGAHISEDATEDDDESGKLLLEAQFVDRRIRAVMRLRQGAQELEAIFEDLEK